NCGACTPSAACWPFHLSTSCLTSSFSWLRSAICASSALNRPTISAFTCARSAAARPPSGLASIAAYWARNAARVSSAMLHVLDGGREGQPFLGSHELLGVEHDEQPLVAAYESAHEVPRESAVHG